MKVGVFNQARNADLMNMAPKDFPREQDKKLLVKLKLLQGFLQFICQEIGYIWTMQSIKGEKRRQIIETYNNTEDIWGRKGKGELYMCPDHFREARKM